MAGELAKSVEGATAPREKVHTLYRTIFARDPSEEETVLGVKYLGGADVARYTQALLATNEVIFWP